MKFLFLILFFVCSFLSSAWSAELCSQVLKLRRTTVSTLSADDQQKQIKQHADQQSDQFLEKIKFFIEESPQRRVDIDLADLILKEMTPVIEKNGEFIRSQVLLQTSVLSQISPQKLLKATKEFEATALALSRLTARNKNLMARLAALFPKRAERRADRLGRELNTQAGKIENYEKKLRVMSYDFSVLESNLKNEVSDLNLSIEKIKNARAVLQAELWSLEKEEGTSVDRLQRINAYREAISLLERQIPSLASMVAITAAHHSQLEVLLNQVKNALLYSYDITKNKINLLSSLTENGIKVKPVEHVEPLQVSFKDFLSENLKRFNIHLSPQEAVADSQRLEPVLNLFLSTFAAGEMGTAEFSKFVEMSIRPIDPVGDLSFMAKQKYLDENFEKISAEDFYERLMAKTAREALLLTRKYFELKMSSGQKADQQLADWGCRKGFLDHENKVKKLGEFDAYEIFEDELDQINEEFRTLKSRYRTHFYDSLSHSK